MADIEVGFTLVKETLQAIMDDLNSYCISQKFHFMDRSTNSEEIKFVGSGIELKKNKKKSKKCCS